MTAGSGVVTCALPCCWSWVTGGSGVVTCALSGWSVVIVGGSVVKPGRILQGKSTGEPSTSGGWKPDRRSRSCGVVAK